MSEQISGLLQTALSTCSSKQVKPAEKRRVSGLKRLSGGANMETWAFDCVADDVPDVQLILRRLAGDQSSETQADEMVSEISLDTEAEVVRLAGQYGVAVPTVVQVLAPEHNLGIGYVMTRESGEALPFRLLSDERYAEARKKLAYQCGQAAARIHQVPVADLPAAMEIQTHRQRLDRWQKLADRFGNSSPVHQMALNWLYENEPANTRQTLVHGDFRNGNLLVDDQGLAAVLDWELAHVGNPVEDLGYFCSNVWRFGHSHNPAGGFGSYEELLAGYESVMGFAPDMSELHYWEVHTAVTWGLCCGLMLGLYRSGQDKSLERAAIGRRFSESEIDLLLLLEGRYE